MDGSENFQTMNRNTQKVQGSMGEASARCQLEEDTMGTQMNDQNWHHCCFCVVLV